MDWKISVKSVVDIFAKIFLSAAGMGIQDVKDPVT